MFVFHRLRNAFDHIPLRWRLALVSFGLLAVLLAALGVVISVEVERELLLNQANSLTSSAMVAIKPFTHGGANQYQASDPQQVAYTLVNELQGPDLASATYSTSGQLMYASPQHDFGPSPVTLSQSQIQSYLANPHPAPYLLVQGPYGERQLVVLLEIRYDPSQQVVELLQVNSPTEAIDAAVSQLRLLVGIGIAVALGLAAALTVPLMNTVLRPLVTMERTSRRIAEGDLSLRLRPPAADDEVGRLARSFNNMVAHLESAFNRQKRFVSDVSHELRTPITALNGGIEMLLLGADAGDPEASRRLLRGMYAETDRMRHLVEDLLTLTRVDEGHLDLRKQPIDMAQLLRDVGESGERLTRDHIITYDVRPDVPPVLGDPERLKQVLLNLLENAAKYTPPGGRITLAARPDGPNRVALDVRDTGSGIPADALPHVFERFYRADPSRTRNPNKAGGSGLGLAIAKSLIEAQGGAISIASTVGEGTTVTVHVPAAPPASAPARPQPAPTPTGEAKTPV